MEGKPLGKPDQVRTRVYMENEGTETLISILALGGRRLRTKQDPAIASSAALPPRDAPPAGNEYWKNDRS